MKYLYFLFFLVTSHFYVKSQTVIFEDSFESYNDFTINNFGDWKMYDLDETPTWGVPECNFINEGYTGSAIVFNPYQCTDDQMGEFNPEAGNYSVHTGQKYVSFWCAQEVTNDNYLISPRIDLTNVTTPVLSLWGKSLASATNGFDPERFELLLSTIGNNVEDFTYSLGEVNEISTCCNWNEYSYNLTDFEGEQVYIAIHHISSESAYALHIDDFKVTAVSTTGISQYETVKVALFPTPFHEQINIESDEILEEVRVVNILGKEILYIIPNAERLTIETADFSQGVYIVFIKTPMHLISRKILKN